jgi:hypothetical protein
MNDVHKLTIQIRAPRGSFAGGIAEGWYVVADGAVVLTDEKGQPIGEAKRQLNPGSDARLIACAMLRARRRSSHSLADFTAPISYQQSKYL